MKAPETPPTRRDPDRPHAILLVGPTGSGKTPLGDVLEAGGLWGRPCRHFDFGRCLRMCALGEGHWAGLTRDECTFLGGLVAQGALLEDEHFHMAERLLGSFLAGGGAGAGTRVVLNGLPRHVGQAKEMERLVLMEAVVHLTCSPEVAWSRIQANVGGDRTHRPDDDLDAVRRRMGTFQDQTSPLLAYYRDRGVPVLEVEVGTDTTAEQMRRALDRTGAGENQR